MSEDITVLGLAVDSTGVLSASEALDRMAASGGKAETAASAFESAIKQAGVAAKTIDPASFAASTSTAASALNKQAASLKGVGDASKLTAFQTQQLSFQLQDFFVQCQSGQSPLTALIEQGSQLSGTFGSVGGAIGAVASLLTPAVVGIGAAATAVAALGIAAYEGSTQAAAFEKSLILTGNAAGLTATSFDTAAKSIAAASKTSIGSAKEILQAFASTGEFGPKSIGAVSEAAATLARISGESSDDVVKAFARMQDGVAKWSVGLNKSFNFLTGAQYDYIKQLESQGKTEEAAKFAADALNTALKERERPLGTIMQALKDGRELWSKFWDAAQDIGRPETVQDKLAKVRAELAALNSNSKPLSILSPAGVPTGKSGRSKSDLQDAEYLLGIEGALEDRAAVDRAAKDEKNKNDLLNRSETYESALTALMAAGNTARSALQAATLQKDRLGLDESYNTAQLDLTSYMNTRYALESAGIKQQEANVAAEIALEKQRKPGSVQERIQQEAKLIELASKRYEIDVARVRLESQRKNFELVPTNIVERPDPPEDAFRRSEIKAQPALEQASTQRVAAAAMAAHDLLTTNEQMNVSLIKDDQLRGQAQIALEVDTLRKRLDLTSMDDETRRQGTDALAAYQVARQAQLTEQLKPEFERILDGWSNTTKLMRDSYDEFGTGLLRTGEDVWVNFAKTGKLSISSLKDFAVEEFAKIQFRELVGVLNKDGGVASAIGSLFGISKGPASTSAADAIQAAATAAKTADTTITSTHTLSVTTNTLAIDAMAASAIAATAALTATAAAAGSSGLASIFDKFTLAGSSPDSVLTGAAFSGGFGSGALDSIGDLLFDLLPGFASGGSIGANTVARVAEKGPELLQQGGQTYLLSGNQGGYITPNDRLQGGGGGGGGGGGDTFHFDFSGQTVSVGEGVSPAQFRAVLQENNRQQEQKIIAKMQTDILRSKRTGGAFA